MMIDFNLNTFMIMIVAMINAYTAWLAFHTHGQIDLLEKNTNSIKDALVASTAKASRAEGVTAGRLEERFEKDDGGTPDSRIIQKETVVERVVKKEK